MHKDALFISKLSKNKTYSINISSNKLQLFFEKLTTMM